MKAIKSVARTAIWLAILAAEGPSVAQVPPHPPGTICFTPRFWCWLPTQGIPGQPCFCQSPYGPIQGVVG